MAEARKTVTAPKVGLVTPPPVARVRDSSVPSDISEAMVSLIDEGWVSDNETYSDKKTAGLSAGRHKRAVAFQLAKQNSKSVEAMEKTIATRTYEHPEGGGFVFALGRKAERQPAAS